MKNPDGRKFEFEGGDQQWVECTNCHVWRMLDSGAAESPGAAFVCPGGCTVFTLNTEELLAHPEGLPKRKPRAK